MSASAWSETFVDEPELGGDALGCEHCSWGAAAILRCHHLSEGTRQPYRRRMEQPSAGVTGESSNYRPGEPLRSWDSSELVTATDAELITSARWFGIAAFGGT